MNDMNQNIGQAIKSRRKELHVTQQTLAMLANVSINTVVAIERGTKDSSLSTIQRICDVLGLKVIAILKD